MKPEEFKILIIDEAHPVLMQKLGEFDVRYRPDIEVDELKQLIKDYQGLVLRSKLRITKEWLDLGTQLKIIGRLGSGMDNIDVETAEKRGIICLNAPEGNRDAVAEQTIGMLLGLLSNIPRAVAEVRSHIWNRYANTGTELNSLTVGIIGFGNVGSVLADKLRGFGCRIIAYDLYKTGFANSFVEEVSLKSLMKEADVITLHVPLNEYSRNMINDDFISKLSKPVYLLNLSRGEVLDTRAALKGLDQGKILGLALDVLDNENMESLTEEQLSILDALAKHPSVILTPHIGGLTKNSFEKLGEILGSKMHKKINSILL